MRKLRGVGFVAHDPLIDQAVEDLRIAFGFAVDELLVAAQRAHVAQQDDVVLDACHDAVDDFLRRADAKP